MYSTVLTDDEAAIAGLRVKEDKKQAKEERKKKSVERKKLAQEKKWKREEEKKQRQENKKRKAEEKAKQQQAKKKRKTNAGPQQEEDSTDADEPVEMVLDDSSEYSDEVPENDIELPTMQAYPYAEKTLEVRDLVFTSKIYEPN